MQLPCPLCLPRLKICTSFWTKFHALTERSITSISDSGVSPASHRAELKAFFMSKAITITSAPGHADLADRPAAMTAFTASVVDLPGRKPNCRGVRRRSLSLYSLLARRLSSTLPGILIRQIGRKDVVVCPGFLGFGMSFKSAVFHSAGISIRRIRR